MVYCKIQKQVSPNVFLGKGVMKICIKFTGKHPCPSEISIKLQSNFIEIKFWDRCSPVTQLNTFRKPFIENISEWLLLKINNERVPEQNLIITKL